jgi:hypothetical protein
MLCQHPHQEVRLLGQNLVQAERLNAQQLIKGHPAKLTLHNLHGLVDGLQAE